MTFQGRFVYASEADARRAVEAFAHSPHTDQSVVLALDLTVCEAAVSFDVDACAPSSWWQGTCRAIASLSVPARDGTAEAVRGGRDDGTCVSRVRLLPGGREEEIVET